MKVINDTQSLRDFEAWSGAKDTKQAILDADKEAEFEALIDELYPDGLTDTHLNDILWFESEWVFESLGMEEDEEEEEEEETEEEE